MNQVFRVTVRGQFTNLSDEARRYLVKAQAEHDLFVSAYTPEGTLSYDERILFFNMRYEVHADSEEKALASSFLEAETFLQTMGFAHKQVKANAVDVSQIWNSPNEVAHDN
jgi:hypothetical protein